MLRVDTILFSNTTTSIQRTAHLTGGAVRGLPGGNVIEGLKGINSFNSEMAEAQKEFHQGRLQSSLARVRQMEMTFNGIVGRWNGTVNAILTSARQGKLNLSLQKLNEVKNAQAKMQQLTAPVNKTFRDLISALDHAAMSETHTDDPPATNEGFDSPDSPHEADEAVVASRSSSETAVGTAPDTEAGENEAGENVAGENAAAENAAGENVAAETETPDPNLLDRFAEKYQYGVKLGVRKDASGTARLDPPLQNGQFYFFAGSNPPAVVRVREIHRKSVLVYDPRRGAEIELDPAEIIRLIRSGIWVLQPR